VSVLILLTVLLLPAHILTGKYLLIEVDEENLAKKQTDAVKYKNNGGTGVGTKDDYIIGACIAPCKPGRRG